MPDSHDLDVYYQHQPARFAEGWELFQTIWGHEIQSLDEPPDGVTAPETDLDAIVVTLRGAINGKPHALHALEFIGYREGLFAGLPDALASVERCVADSCSGLCQHEERQQDWRLLHESGLYLNHSEGTEESDA